MEIIQRLPFIIGSIMAILVGIVNLGLGATIQDTYIKIAVSLVLFFALGIYIRSFLIKLLQEVDIKKKAQEEELHKKRDQERREARQNEQLNEGGADSGIGVKGSVIDYEADYGEDFTPLKVADVLSRKLDK